MGGENFFQGEWQLLRENLGIGPYSKRCSILQQKWESLSTL
jgi:hypothetical protein